MKKLMFMAAIIAAGMMFTSCKEPVDPNKPDNKNGANVTETEIEIIMDGVLKTGTTLNLNKHLVIPEGQSLTIEPGCQIIVSTDGVGINNVPIEIEVKGNLYCLGTAAQPILFSVAPEKRTKEDILTGLWGGIMAYKSCGEMVIDHTIIEYTGGQVIEGSPAAEAEYYTAGDDAYPQVTTNNVNGKYIFINSIFRNGWSDGIYMMGGDGIIANNIFAANGKTGGESVNLKAGVTADVAQNIIFSPNTNGLKHASVGQSDVRYQAKHNSYNNTVINAGWRRDGEKGGGIFAEKNCLINVVNNLMVNCKFKARTPDWENKNSLEGGIDSKSVIDYNMYSSGPNETKFVLKSGVKTAWQGYNYKDKKYDDPSNDTHSKIATESNMLNPKFVNFDINTVPVDEYVYNDAWDFHLTAGSPALEGAMQSGLTPYFANGLVVNGKKYTSPALQPYFGAFGTK